MQNSKQILIKAIFILLFIPFGKGVQAAPDLTINVMQKKPEGMTVVTDTQKKRVSIQEIRDMVADKGYDFTVDETRIFKLPLEERKKLCGFIPTSIDENHLTKAGVFLSLPASFDWRDSSDVTSVKDQQQCGSCWVFAAVGDLESKVLIGEEDTSYDFSEQNLLSCNFYGYDCNSGGNYLMTTNFLTQVGPSLESCASYQGINGISCNTSCSIIKNVNGWKRIASDTTTIKTALFYHGPIYTSMYAGDPAFDAYTGGVYEYSGLEDPNHAVLIVGWDDFLGAWIVKNSWDTDWGIYGYFNIAYDSARIGEGSNYISSYKDYDANETLLYYDDGGYTVEIGYGTNTCYGAVIFTPSVTGSLTAVDFWTVDDDISPIQVGYCHQVEQDSRIP